ncbi:MAG: replicative DNA helicase [Burkholderiales bacterium]|nr:replicative DNA helicase [Burkholderiales bacterium]
MKRDDIPPPDDEVGPLRVPPHSMEAEQAVLGALLLDSAAFDAAGGIVTADDFYRFEHREIFAAIAALSLACKRADMITVHEAMEAAGKADRCGGLVYLNELAANSPGAFNVRAYAEIVRKRSFERAVITATMNAGSIAWGDGTVEAKLDRISTLITTLQRRGVTSAPRSIAEIAAARTDHYAALEEGTVATGWPTGIPKLDEMLNGGFAPGRLYIVAARPSVGKSSFSQAIAQHMASHGLPALFLSQEMSANEVADRGVANAGRVSYTALLSGKMETQGWSRACDALEQLGRTQLMVDDQPALRIGDIRAKAGMVKGLKVLVVDYLQLCGSDLVKENRNSQIEEISRGLKALAKQLDIAVIALSQLNRDVEKRKGQRPTLADLRDSGAIEQDADTVIFLWPVKTLSDGRKLIGCGVDKNRAGRCGQFGLDFDGDIQRWGESVMSVETDESAKPKGKSKWQA